MANAIDSEFNKNEWIPMEGFIAVAKEFGISVQTVQGVIMRYNELKILKIKSLPFPPRPVIRDIVKLALDKLRPYKLKKMIVLKPRKGESWISFVSRIVNEKISDPTTAR